jgi:uncharacterized protein YpmS
MKNNWKRFFFLLVGVNLLFVVIILWSVMTPDGNQPKNHKEPPNNQTVSFHVKSNKNDLNMLINHYLKQETADSPIAYRVILGNEVELYGALPIFSEKINLKLTFEPVALQNGDLVLKQKSISVGSLRLPVSYVLNFISDNYKIPKGVDIQPNDKQIYVHMQKLNLKSNIRIKVNKFDLKKDDISLTILVPVE